MLDGNVVDAKNVKVGSLTKDGDIINSNNQVIASANYLQFYKYPAQPEFIEDDEDGKVIEQDAQDDKLSEEIVDVKNTVEDDKKETTKTIEKKASVENQKNAASLKSRLQHERIGIAITPGGSYIGDILDDNKVIDEEGNEVGELTETGEIVGKDGKVIGVSDKIASEEPKKKSKRDWLKVISGTTVSPYAIGNDVTNVGPGGGIGPGGRYNPQRAAILSELHQERRRNLTNAVITSGYSAESYTGWQDDWKITKQVSTLRVDMSNMITADKPIPAVLARSLVSLGGAPVTAIVERNIYGDSGRNVIIPAGSKIIGGLQTVDSASRFDATTGGVKIDISWERIIRPDGIAFFISSSHTGDAQGRGGGALGYVDEQLIKKYTLPVVGTMVASAITYMTAATEESEGEIENSKQQAASDARQQFMEKMDEILQEIIESKKQIEPVTYVPAGTRVIIYPMTDLWLRTTKDIDKGEKTNVPSNVSSQLVVSDGNPSSQGATVTTSGQGQTVVLGNKKTGNQQDEDFVPLVANDGNQSNNNQQQKRNRALPPVYEDGAEINMSDEDEEDSDDGEIDLSF